MENRQLYGMNIAPKKVYDETVDHVLSIISESLTKTLGPGGCPNLFKVGSDITASKDGLENLSFMRFSRSAIADAVWNIVHDVAFSQANNVGDGTTTAAIMTDMIYKELMKSGLFELYTYSNIANAMREIQAHLIHELAANSIKIDPETDDGIKTMIAVLDTTLNGNSTLVDLIMNVYRATPNFADTNILIEHSMSSESTFNSTQGFTLNGSMMQGFSADGTCCLSNVHVVVVDGGAFIDNNVIEYTKRIMEKDESLLIMCTGVNDNFFHYIQALGQSQPALLRNICVVYSQACTIQDSDLYWDLLRCVDCGVLPESPHISKDTLGDIHLGFAKQVIIKNKLITFGDCNKGEDFDIHIDKLQAAIDEISRELENCADSTEKAHLTVKLGSLKSRYAKLMHGSTTIYAGGDTHASKHITFRQIEDGVKALQNSLKYGVYPGCNSIVPSILLHLIHDQCKILNGVNSIYTKLYEVLLVAYIRTTTLVLGNMFKDTTMAETLVWMTDSVGIPDIASMYNVETGKFVISDDGILLNGEIPKLYAFDITRSNRTIVNPAKTELNIVEKSIDAALVLATSNTIIVDKCDFEAMISDEKI